LQNLKRESIGLEREVGETQVTCGKLLTLSHFGRERRRKLGDRERKSFSEMGYYFVVLNASEHGKKKKGNEKKTGEGKKKKVHP